MKISRLEYKKYEADLKDLFKKIFKVTDSFCDMIFEKKLSQSDIFAEIFDNKVVAFSYALDFFVKINDEVKKCIYIYGVGVKEDFRGRGLSKKLLNEIYEYYKDKNILFLYLVPADSGLFKMYEKLGYKTEFYLNKTVFDLNYVNEINFDITDGNYSKDLEKFLKTKKLFVLRKKDDIEAVLTYTSYKKSGKSGFLYEKDGTNALVREAFIWSERELYSFLSYLKKLGFEKAIVSNYGNKKVPYAMVKTYQESKKTDFSDAYTNMNFDWF